MLRYILLIGLIAVLLMCQVNSFECPEDDISNGCANPKACLYPDPDDRHGYIQCDDGGLVHYQKCSPGLIWNNRRKICGGSRY